MKKTPIFVGFPYNREGLVCRIITPKTELSIQRDTHGYLFVKVEETFGRNYGGVSGAAFREAKKRGIEVTGEAAVVTYFKLEEVTRELKGGGIEKVFSRREEITYLALCSLKRDASHFQSLDYLSLNPKQAFPIGNKCLLLDS